MRAIKLPKETKILVALIVIFYSLDLLLIGALIEERIARNDAAEPQTINVVCECCCREEDQVEPESVKEVPAEEPIVEPEIGTQVKPDPEPDMVLSDSEIDLIALVTMGEAEDEPEAGKRLVIDTILNRVDSPYFPDTVNGVIYQKNQFSCMWDGRIDRCYVRDDIRQLVREELVKRLNYECVFFRAGRYGDYGVPLFRVGAHYFSKYN